LPRGAARLRANLSHFSAGDVIAFSSSADVQIFRNLVATCRAEVAVLPFFVEERLFRPLDARRRSELRRDLAIGEKDVVFLYVGRISSEKNVHFLVRSLAHLIGRKKNVSFLIVGPQWNAPFDEFRFGPCDVRALIQSMTQAEPVLRERIRLLGPVPRSQLRDLYCAADVFVNGTLHHDENFGFTQVEAMSCGLPVVGTNWGGLKDTIRHGVNGFRVDTWMTDWGIRADASQLIQACERLLKSETLRGDMGAESRRIAVREYGLPAFRRRLLELVSSSVAARGTKRSNTRNRLTTFGRQYEARMRRKADIRYGRKDYELYERLLLPYCSGRNEGSLSRRDLISPAAHALVVRKSGVEVQDPLWPGHHRINPVERRLLATLQRSSALSLSVEELIDRSDERTEAWRVCRAIERLSRLGVLVRNKSHLPRESARDAGQR
jgi:hypothetical protein